MQSRRLDADRIEQARAGGALGARVVVFESTASTNDIAWEYARSARHHGLAVLAETQLAGRGRGSHVWHSEPGQSILCSVVLRPCRLGAELLSLTAAVAVCESLLGYTGRRARIKWPNDIVVDGRKVAGILIESRRKDTYVIGIGINVYQDRSYFEGKDFALSGTSLAVEAVKGDVPSAGESIDRNMVTALLLETLETRLRDAEKRNRIITGRWQELSSQLGHRVAVEYDGRQYAGQCIGIDPREGLILQLERTVKIFPSAHTTILKHQNQGVSK